MTVAEVAGEFAKKVVGQMRIRYFHGPANLTKRGAPRNCQSAIGWSEFGVLIRRKSTPKQKFGRVFMAGHGGSFASQLSWTG
jgi:hypothetical protein